MSMRVISWEEYIGFGVQGTGSEIAVPIPHTPYPIPLSITIGVFDGVHLGHQSLIRRICDPRPPTPDPSPNPKPHTPYPIPPIPTVVTFRENPIKSISPAGFAGDIYSLEQKLGFLESLGVKLTVLIDFSKEISKINGRDFIDLLLGKQPVTLLALGENFRCGQGRDTGIAEIQALAKARGVETWVAPVVMDGGKPVSSNRIRQALAAGRFEEAQRMLDRPLDSITFNTIVPK